MVTVALAPSATARTLPLDSWDVLVDYGDRVRHEVFHDTLAFTDSTGATVQATEAEVTCECVTAEVLDDGRLALRFEVLPEELDGVTDKLVYVFTDHPEFDLLRVKLRVTVLPGDGGPSSAPSAPDSAPPTPGQVPDKPPVRTTQDDLESDDTRGTADDRLAVGFFHSPGCRICARIKEHTLPRLRERWGDQIAIESISLDERAGFNRLLAVREHYQVQRSGGSFLIAVGDTVLQTTDDLLDRLNAAVARSLDTGTTTYLAEELATIDPERGPPADRTRSVFRSLSFWAVAGAGLLDGINPCAFATLVFFVSLLSYAGSTKRQVLIVGTGFTVAVFVVYLLLGLGAFRALQALAAYRIVAQAIWWLTVALLAVLFVLSVRDTVQYYRTGQTRDALLQLPRGTKRRIHNAMRRGLSTRNLLLAALGIGVTVTLFEAACTGQVYLPAIVLMLNDPVLSERAFLYLVVYNLLFVLPLVIVFALTYAGVGSGAFAAWSKRNYGGTRIALSALFLALAVLMVAQMP